MGLPAVRRHGAGAVTASHARPDNQFTLLAIEHHAINNLGAQATKPTAPHALTALVVGLAGEALTTDRGHRVKVQFAWQRGLQPNAGGLAHASALDSKGNAPGNEQSGTWVRVAQPAAGANWGVVYTPRTGTEISIGFVEADVDRSVSMPPTELHGRPCWT
jgi:type VI secretion system secreted protein VgrG